MAGDPSWFTWVQTIGIVAGIVFTGYQIKKNGKAGQVANLLKLIELHRDLWKLTIGRPDLLRPFEHNLKPGELALSQEERRFVSFLMLHISGSFALAQSGEVAGTGDFKGDVAELLSLPAIRKFWEENKRLYDPQFVSYMDSCVRQPSPINAVVTQPSSAKS